MWYIKHDIIKAITKTQLGCIILYMYEKYLFNNSEGFSTFLLESKIIIKLLLFKVNHFELKHKQTLH